MISGTLKGGFRFANSPFPAPTVGRVTPILASLYLFGGFQDIAGGTNISVEGTGFISGCRLSFRQGGVEIGSASGGSVSYTGPTLITVTCPALAAGVYDLVVVNPDLQTSGVSGNAKHRSWAPSSDTTTGLFLPGSYSVTGTQGTNAVGTWLDTSGNGRNFTSGITGLGAFPNFCPTAHADGYPVIDASITQGLGRLATSLAGDQGVGYAALCQPNDGAYVVIAKWSGALTAYAGTWTNPAMVCGSGASAGLLADRKGVRFEGYDAVDYVEAQSFAFDADIAIVCAGKWDSIGIYSSTMGKPWSPLQPYSGAQTSLSAGDVGPDTYIGTGFGGDQVWNGDIIAVAFYPHAADLTSEKLLWWDVWAKVKGYVTEVEAIDPTALDLSSLQLLPYAGIPWTGVVSAGSSGGRHLTTAGGSLDPTVGATLVGQPTADFDGTQYCIDGTSNDVLFSSTGSFFVMFKSRSQAAPSGLNYGDGNFFGDGANAETTFGITTAGVLAAIYAGGVAYARVDVPGGTDNQWHIAQFRFDGEYLTGRLDGGLWHGVDCGPYVPSSPGLSSVGRSYTATFFDGLMAMKATADVALTYAEFEGLVAHLNLTYGMAF